ncbi:type II toxin-antitoxin system RelE/ParE family toxin [Brucella anthropi]|uniref:type II toxin-antitoxin system RelE/ParE family toxin n=1 Tax=Brucella anthropi TaxID=529 RepID=UPI0034E558CE
MTIVAAKYHLWYIASMIDYVKKLPAKFYRTESGRQPVREWLLDLPEEDRKIVGDDIRTAEFGWPIGMPLCRPMSGTNGLWEIRTNLPGGRISRVLFCVHDGQMALLHGFIKKTQKTPQPELKLAEQRMRGLK